jgi:hypothetical protein
VVYSSIAFRATGLGLNFSRALPPLVRFAVVGAPLVSVLASRPLPGASLSPPGPLFIGVNTGGGCGGDDMLMDNHKIL